MTLWRSSSIFDKLVHAMWIKFFSVGILLFLTSLSLEAALDATPGQNMSPYEAFYDLELLETLSEPMVLDACGQMTVVCQEVGAGWAFHQKGFLDLTYEKADKPLDPEGDFVEEPSEEVLGEATGKQRITWVYTTWEAKNGRHFRFIWKRWVDSMLDEDIEGEVDYDPQGKNGRVTYRSPYFMTQPLHGDILFPIQYLEKILDQMTKREPAVISRIVFYGTHLQGPFRLNTFVGEAHLSHMKTLEKKILSLEVWPTFTASYHPLSIQAQGESEISYTLTEKGIPVSSLMNLGEFKIKAMLRALPEKVLGEVR